MEQEKRDEGSRWPYWAASGSLLLVLFALYWMWPDYRSFINEAWEVLSSGNSHRIEVWVDQFGLWGPLLITFLMVLQMFLLIAPSWMLMVIAVLAYGSVIGCLIGIFAVAVASTVGYGIGRLVGEHTLYRFLGKSSERAIQRETEAYGMWAVVVTRLNPLLSNDAISILAGMLCLGYVKFIIATLVGITPWPSPSPSSGITGRI